MRYRANSFRSRKRIESCLLVCTIVAVSIAIMLPMTAPKAKAQVTHLGSAAEEDNNPAYDVDSTPFVVEWTDAEDHILNQNYVVNTSYELVIPALNYFDDPDTQHEITVHSSVNITVQGGAKLTMQTDGLTEPTKTAFFVSGFGMWDGIYFEPGSEGVIQDVIIQKAMHGIVFSPGSIIGGGGIGNAVFESYGQYGVRMDGAVGDTVISKVDFLDWNRMGTAVYVSNGMLTIALTLFNGQGLNLPQLRIRNASVSVDESAFLSGEQPGYGILVENSPAPNSTVVSDTQFANGVNGTYYIRTDGASPFIDECSFYFIDGADTIIANENTAGVPSHPILRNPNRFDVFDVFDNATINATGTSTVTLQWYLDVYVDDPNRNPISDSQVNVSFPSQPASKMTDTNGWAKGFIVTELIRHNNTEDNFNRFNVSAENNTMFGYAEPFMNKSQSVYITVPFNPVPNTLPEISYISTPIGIQTGPITIDFIIEDPDPGDTGDLYVRVMFWDPIDASWKPPTAHSSSDPTTGLSSGIMYSFVWDSRNPQDFQNKYGTQVYIQIVAHDASGFNGTPVSTGNFTVDNKWPVVLSGPTVTAYDTYAVIEWTVDELAQATVQFGLYGDGTMNDLTSAAANLTFSTQQTITLTNLLPGRRYTYIIESTDDVGNHFSSAPITYTFDTKVYIPLYTGWNMISIPYFLADVALGDVLATIAGDWDIAQWYDALDPDDQWKTNYTSKPDYMNDLSEYFPGRALWLHVTTDTLLIPNHNFDGSFPGEGLPLVEGWNFVGYNSVQTRSIADALISIDGSYDKVEHYDAQSGQWLTYDGSSGTLTTMELGRGYWIHCTQEVMWSLSYV